jgi:hypothetical protein
VVLPARGRRDQESLKDRCCDFDSYLRNIHRA